MAWLGMAWQGAVVRRAEEMVARMQVQLAAMEKEAAHKDTVLDRLLAHAKSTKQQMRAVEERSRVEKDELRREMTEQQQRMQKLELETAAGREERMRRQLMEAQEGIAHRDAFLQQLQEEASPPLRSNRLPGWAGGDGLCVSPHKGCAAPAGVRWGGVGSGGVGRKSPR
ncbi:unnamed protein product [Closterium sp. NIES-53]